MLASFAFGCYIILLHGLLLCFSFFHSKVKTKHATELSSQCRQPLLQKKVTSGRADVMVTAESDSNLGRSSESAQNPAPDANVIAASTHGAGGNFGANVVCFCFFLSSSFMCFLSPFSKTKV